MPELDDLGRRIMICGPSNSGKSTLAAAISHKLGLPVVHLDLLQHLPNTDWQPRPEAEFQQLHDAAITGDAWVMDGNYSRHLPARLARATGIVLIADNRWANFRRYLWRTAMQKDRVGNLKGGKDSLKWDMVRWILIASPKALVRYRNTLPATGLPFIESRSMRELNQLYENWGLQR